MQCYNEFMSQGRAWYELYTHEDIGLVGSLQGRLIIQMNRTKGKSYCQSMICFLRLCIKRFLLAPMLFCVKRQTKFVLAVAACIAGKKQSRPKRNCTGPNVTQFAARIVVPKQSQRHEGETDCGSHLGPKAGARARM